MLHKTRILVTGHRGFIGRNMTEYLEREGFEVEGWEWDPNRENWPKVQSYDWVVHLGAIADMNYTDVEQITLQNLEFSQWLFNECNQWGTHLQYASSSSVYGKTRQFSEDSPCRPQTPYAWSKWLFDRWVFQQPNIQIKVQGFRYFNVYGRYMALRGNRMNVIQRWRDQAQLEGKITVYEGADRMTRDWTWVGDVCRLHLDFIRQVEGSGIWNVGSGLSHSFLDIAEEIAEQEGAQIEFEPCPNPSEFREHTRADLTLLHQTVGTRPWLNVFEYLDFQADK